ncbi:hypothetical protein ACAH01_11845 [Halomicrobium sp. HM KBTZ05]|uniref:hypothetical protein n=1 Tax=Halomicrobium sp. HM KBTZ05 TaxID=3242663 RepID=UPI0035591422
MLTRQLYRLGCGLGVVGSLVIVANLVVAGYWTFVPIALGAGAACAFALRNAHERDDFDRDHSVVYRSVNLAGAVITVGAGLVMLAVGFLSYQWFVVGTLG